MGSKLFIGLLLVSASVLSVASAARGVEPARPSEPNRAGGEISTLRLSDLPGSIRATQGAEPMLPLDGGFRWASQPGAGASLVGRGEVAFNQYCTQCHDAQRSLEKTKSLAAWRVTVRRMAAQPGAFIPEDVHEAIATYLAARNDVDEAPEPVDIDVDDVEDDVAVADRVAEAPSFTLTGTLAPLWRGGGDSNLQNPGFFGDVWVGANWQGTGALSAQATACISCHNEGPLLNRFELVEATVRLDLSELWRSRCGSEPLLKARVKAGRLVVPFGRFYEQVNPGVYRTVSKPLIYNMGQRVRAVELGSPVLPMPYSDEGAAIDLSLPVLDSATVAFDAYLVNGLQGGAQGVDFFRSRDFVDNNRVPAVGGRLSAGGRHLRLGGSVMGGRFNSDEGTGPLQEAMHYVIYGADVAFRWEDLLRLQFEYAQRDSDRFGNIPAPTMLRERIGGCYVEGEVTVSRCRNLSLLARYDTQSRSGPLPVPGSPLPPDFDVRRFTYGLNWGLPGGSLLMINHEHWSLPADLPSIDVLGVRWSATF